MLSFDNVIRDGGVSISQGNWAVMCSSLFTVLLNSALVPSDGGT